VAALGAGARVTFVGARGNDDFGALAAAGLRREKIDIRHFKVHTGVPSGVALILIGGESRENVIAVAHSANDQLSASTAQAVKAEFPKCDAVVTQLEIPMSAVKEVAKLAHQAGKPFILNPAPAAPCLTIAPATQFIPSRPTSTEAAILTGEQDPERAAQKLVAAGCNAVITLGSKGAMLVTAAGVSRFPAAKVKPVDTVGAGDCFTGWLATGVAEGLSMEMPSPRRARRRDRHHPPRRPGRHAPARRSLLLSSLSTPNCRPLNLNQPPPWRNLPTVETFFDG
jgi:ribokinase